MHGEADLSSFPELGELLAAEAGRAPGCSTGRSPLASLETIVADRVEGLRARAVAMGLMPAHPPYDPVAMARALGIDVHAASSSQKWDAMLVPDDDGQLRIIVNERIASQGRRRFSIAHEIVHALLPRAEERTRMRQKLPRPRADDPVERLCDHGAAALLMPAEHFSRDLRDLGLAPSSLEALAGAYGVSVEAAAVNAAKHASAPVAVAFFAYAWRPTTESASLAEERRRWRVSRAYHAAGFPIYLHPGWAAAEDSVVERAAIVGAEMARDETLAVKGGARAVRIVAKPMRQAGGEPPAVMATMAVWKHPETCPLPSGACAPRSAALTRFVHLNEC